MSFIIICAIALVCILFAVMSLTGLHGNAGV